MSTENRYSSPHLIYADTEYATEEQISGTITKFMNRLSWGDTNFKKRVNVVTTADGAFAGYSYIWVSSDDASQLLTKSENCEYEETYDHVIKVTYSTSTDELKASITEAIQSCLNVMEDEDAGGAEDAEDVGEHMLHFNDETPSTAYLSVKSKAVYHVLLGSNPNGTERVIVVVEGDDDGTSWDCGEMVTKKLPSLVQLPFTITLTSSEEVPLEYLRCSRSLPFDKSINPDPIIYTPEQIDIIKKLEPQRIDFTYQLKFSLAWVTYPDVEKYNKDELIAFGVPGTVGVMTIKDIFRDFVTDKNAKAYVGDRLCTYPIIIRKRLASNDYLVIVKFNPKSEDAMVANKMTRKVKLPNGVVLRFDFSKHKK
jgi:hypothetical protein